MNSYPITFLASFLIWFMFAGVLFLWVSDGRVRKEQVLHALLVTFVAWLVTEAIKHMFPTIRPFMIDGQSALTLTVPNNGSFPSTHTAIAFSLAIALFQHNKKWGSAYLASAILIGIARVLANVHYPVDILGGALVGTLIAVIAEKLHLTVSS
ncbi:phosphatase PAP2 family protein [Patescibacteria group bacterium]